MKRASGSLRGNNRGWKEERSFIDFNVSFVHRGPGANKVASCMGLPRSAPKGWRSGSAMAGSGVFDDVLNVS